MLQDPNVERYIEIVVNPLKKEIEQMKAQIEALNQALRIHDVVGRSEQCAHPRDKREYIGSNMLRCKVCGKEFS
jgi:acetolactate synthase small subunit